MSSKIIYAEKQTVLTWCLTYYWSSLIAGLQRLVSATKLPGADVSKACKTSKVLMGACGALGFGKKTCPWSAVPFGEEYLIFYEKLNTTKH